MSDAAEVIAGRHEIEVSVVVPVSSRSEPLDRLYADFSAPLKQAGMNYEFLFAVEPWRAPLVGELESLVGQGEPITVLASAQTAGESGLLGIGAARARGAIIVTLPPYPRVEPSGLVRLLRQVEGGADMAAARRTGATTSVLNRLQHRAFHILLARTVGGGFRDVACGVLAMRREVLDQVPLYGDFFRFLPVLAHREGFHVLEVPLERHAEDRRTRVYSPGVYLRRIVDLLGLMFLVRFTQKPLRFFGLLGSGFSLAGIAILCALFLQRLGGRGVADRPAMLLGVLLLVMGIQSFAMGLIGEIVVHFSVPKRRLYRLHAQSGEWEDGSTQPPGHID